MTSVFLKKVSLLVSDFNYHATGKIQPAIDEFKRTIEAIINGREPSIDTPLLAAQSERMHRRTPPLSPTLEVTTSDLPAFVERQSSGRGGSLDEACHDEAVKNKLLKCLEQHQARASQLLINEPVSKVQMFSKLVSYSSDECDPYLRLLTNLKDSIECLWGIYQEKQLLNKEYNEKDYLLITQCLFANYIHHNRMLRNMPSQHYLHMFREALRDPVATIQKEEVVTAAENDLKLLLSLLEFPCAVSLQSARSFMAMFREMERQKEKQSLCNQLILRIAEYTSQKEATIRKTHYLRSGVFDEKIKGCITDMHLILSNNRPKSVSHLLNPEINPEIAYPSVLMLKLCDLIKYRVHKFKDQLPSNWWEKKRYLYYSLLERFSSTIAVTDSYSSDDKRCQTILEKISEHEYEYKTAESISNPDQYTDFLTLLKKEISDQRVLYKRYSLMDRELKQLNTSCLTLFLMMLVDYNIYSEYTLRYDTSFSGNTRVSLQNVAAKKQKTDLVLHVIDTLEVFNQLLGCEGTPSNEQYTAWLNRIVLCVLNSVSRREAAIRGERSLQAGHLTTELERTILNLEYHRDNQGFLASNFKEQSIATASCLGV